jgi:hypothetical protein
MRGISDAAPIIRPCGREGRHWAGGCHRSRRRPAAPAIPVLDEARAAGQPLPEAMTIATATSDGIPSARLVMLRGLQGGLVFFTARRPGTSPGATPAGPAFPGRRAGAASGCCPRASSSGRSHPTACTTGSATASKAPAGSPNGCPRDDQQAQRRQGRHYQARPARHLPHSPTPRSAAAPKAPNRRLRLSEDNCAPLLGGSHIMHSCAAMDTGPVNGLAERTFLSCAKKWPAPSGRGSGRVASATPSSAMFRRGSPEAQPGGERLEPSDRMLRQVRVGVEDAAESDLGFGAGIGALPASLNKLAITPRRGPASTCGSQGRNFSSQTGSSESCAI